MAATKWVSAATEAFKGLWYVKMIGIMVRGGHDTALAVPELVFLSTTMELIHEGLRLHQPVHSVKVETHVYCGRRPSLPQFEECHTDHVPKELKVLTWYREALEKAQEDSGSLLWLALTTRHDMAAAVAIGASMHTR